MFHFKPQKFKNKLFVFLPWLAFWNQGGSVIPDHALLNVAVAPTEAKCAAAKPTLRVTVARSPESRSKGLGGRSTPLAADEGMLFVFDQLQAVNFWMKDTLIPLQIAYFDEKGRFLKMYEMPVEKDPSHPLKQYWNDSPTRMALEVAPGTLKGLVKGKSVLCVSSLPPES